MVADERRARPVSGEIMTDPVPDPIMDAGEGDAASPADDIVEADYVVLRHSGRRSDPEPSPRPRTAPTPSLEGMDILRKAAAAPIRPFTSRGGPVFWMTGIGLALVAFWVSGGHALVRHAPFLSERPQARSALGITGVTSRVDASGAKPVLFVDGEAGNDGAEAMPLPPLEISVTGDDGDITRYTLGTSGRPLAPGERFAFSSRLEVPRNGVRTVSVTFAE